MDLNKFDALYDAPAHLVRRLQQVTGAIFDAEAGRFGLTHSQYAVMRVIELSPGMEQREVAAAAHHDAVTTGKILMRLESMGLVRREKGARSKRGQAVHLTDIGRARIAELQPAIDRVQERLLEVFAPEERDLVMTLLSRLARARNRWNEGPDR